MPRLIRVSGGRLVKILQNLVFSVTRQRGSHVRMAKKQDGCTYYVTIPLHPMIDRGTLGSIVRSISACIPEEIIRSFFFK